MKKFDQFFSVILIPADFIMIFAAFIVAYFARSSSLILPVIYIWPFEQYLKLALIMTPLWILVFIISGLYSVKRKGLAEIGQIITSASLGAMILVLWVFLNRSDFFSRLIVFYIWILAIIFVLAERTILHLVKTSLLLFNIGKRKLILLGEINPTTLRIIQQVKNKPSLGYRIIGYISDKNNPKSVIENLGPTAELEKIIKKYKADEVIVTDNKVDDEMLFNYLRTCQENGVGFKSVPTYAQAGVKTLEYDNFAGLPIIEFRGTALDGWGWIAKRLCDAIISIFAIIILSPVYLVISVIIKTTSKGPIVYRNIRIGDKGEFETLKFRTMYIEYCTGKLYGGTRAEKFEDTLIQKQNLKKGSAVYKIYNDPRVTPIGNFLRRTSLDELPQFFNVLAGNMSVVGPRPHQPKEVKNYTPEQRKLLLIKPGITGVAQISGRSDLTFDEEAILDIFYLENWTIWLDFYIILRTIRAVLFGKGSY